MKSRVFWNTLMNETILVQELHLPPSGLSRLEEHVPIPKFIGFETTGYVSTRYASTTVVDDSYFQYHFLAQVAHRIILTRIRHSLYFYCKTFYPRLFMSFCRVSLILIPPQPTQEPFLSQPSTPNSTTNSNNGAPTSPLPSSSPTNWPHLHPATSNPNLPLYPL